MESWQEGEAGVMELSARAGESVNNDFGADCPEAIEYMIRYLYQNQYNVSTRSTER